MVFSTKIFKFVSVFSYFSLYTNCSNRERFCIDNIIKKYASTSFDQGKRDIMNKTIRDIQITNIKCILHIVIT